MQLALPTYMQGQMPEGPYDVTSQVAPACWPITLDDSEGFLVWGFGEG